MGDIEIKKIEIKIGEETIKLSLEQAKELKDILNQTFEPKTEVSYYPSRYPSPPWKYIYWPWTGDSQTITYSASLS